VSEGCGTGYHTVVPERGEEAKLKVVLCQNFKCRCKRKAVKKCEDEESRGTSMLGLCHKGMKAD
jgi:hypothetical protein